MSAVEDIQNSKSVLIVDDEPGQLDSLTQLMSVSGYEVGTATTGNEAIAALSRNTYDTVLLDLNMPRMNGIEFLEEIREDPRLRKLVVFVLTTSKADEDKVAAYEKNVAGYIVKSDVGNDFMRVVTMLDHYWRVVELPPDN